MTTIIETLDRPQPPGLLNGIFLEGECYALAIALHQGLGWKMLGLMDEDVIRHALVQTEDGQFFDARGCVAPGKLGQPFGIEEPYTLKIVSELDLVREGETTERREHTIALARRMAELHWPDLPWQNSLAQRVVGFANELELLSRKHGLWIRSSLPTARPIIYEGFGDEDGYSVKPTPDGFSFTLDRRLR